MPSHPLDFLLQANFYVTEELLGVFDEQRKMNRWLQVEAALARSQANLGVIPEQAASEIEAKAHLDHIDLAALKEEYQHSRNSLMPVVKGLRKACRDNWGQYVHYGATTQDILDTAQILELEETLQIVYRDLMTVEELLLGISNQHKNTPMIARTHGQQALPTTLGLKTVVWAAEIRRHIERVKSIYPRAMFGQLSGAVGTMAALGNQAFAVAEQTMTRLNLGWKPPSWHTARDNMAEIASIFSVIAGTLEKIANEVFLLGKTEVSELAEQAPGSIMSSTMPHKRNPVLCQRVTVLARQIRQLAGTVVESMAHEHERDPRLLWSEWLAMPQLSMYTGTSLQYMVKILDGLEVLEENMKKNLNLHKETVMSEWLLFRLAPELGKMEAQEKLHAIARKADGGKLGMKEIIMQDSDLSILLTKDDMEMLDHPERYTGLATQLVEQGLADIAIQKEHDPEVLHR